MCDLDKMMAVANRYFGCDDHSIPTTDRPVISFGTRHYHTLELTVLIDGRIEFNSYSHRRDAWDIMLFFNLYVKKLPNGQYEAGSHDEGDLRVYIADKPTAALTEMAWLIL